MKRLWIGIAILALLLAGGIALAVSLSAVHTALSQDLDGASAAAMLGDWEQALALTDRANHTWNRYRHFSAAFTDHEPLEQLDILFAQLQVLRNFPAAADYAALCTHLSQLSAAIAESHTLTWWNLL